MNSWLVTEQRQKLRKQFLDLSQNLKDSDLDGWNKLKLVICLYFVILMSRNFRDYLYLVDLRKRENLNTDTLVKENCRKMLKLLHVKAPQFVDIQKKILNSFSTNVSLLEIPPHRDLCLKMIEQNEHFRSYFVDAVGGHFKEEDSNLFVMEKLADLLSRLVLNCDKNVATHVLEDIDNSIEIPFYKDELRNCLIVKIDERIKGKR